MATPSNSIANTTNGSMFYLDLREHYHVGLIEKFYNDIMMVCFPINDERDDLEYFVESLDPAVQEMNPRLFVLVACAYVDQLAELPSRAQKAPLRHEPVDPSRIVFLGAACGELFAKSHCAMMTYIATSQKFTKRGIANILVSSLKEHLDKTVHSYAPRESCILFAETHKMGIEDDVMSVAQRHQVLQKMNFSFIDMQYVQPPIHYPDSSPVDDLVLLMYNGDLPEAAGEGSNMGLVRCRHHLPAAIVKAFYFDFCQSLHDEDWQFETAEYYKNFMAQFPNRQSFKVKRELPWIHASLLKAGKDEDEEENEVARPLSPSFSQTAFLTDNHSSSSSIKIPAVPNRRRKLTVRNAHFAEEDGNHEGSLPSSSPSLFSIPSKKRMPVVVVIGGGVAGLSAANCLLQHQMRPVIVEASSVLGGRLREGELLSCPLDLGGEIVHGEHCYVSRLAASRNVSLKFSFEVDELGPSASIYLSDGTSLLPLTSDQIHPEVKKAIDSFAGLNDLMAKNPHTDSVLELLHLDGVSKKGLEYIDARYAQTWCIDLKRFGASECVKEGEEWNYGYKNFTVKGGLAHLVLGFFKELLHGVETHLSWPASHVTQTGDGVVVESKDGKQIRADYAIVTVPLPILQGGDLAFSPPLPLDKQKAIQSIRMESGMKVFCMFSGTHWPRDCSLIICPVQPYSQIWFDTLIPKDGSEPKHIAVGFCTSTLAKQKASLTSEQSIELLLSQLAAIFGENVRKTYLGGTSHHWDNEPYIRGAYSAASRDAIDLNAILARPFERLFFAGEATHSLAYGMVHTAIETGIRAAQEVCNTKHSLKDSVPSKDPHSSLPSSTSSK